MNLGATLLGQLLTFLLFVWFSMRFVWPPLLATLQKRKAKIADGLTAAAKSEQLLKDTTERCAVMLTEANLQVRQKLEDAAKQGQAILSAAKQEDQRHRQQSLVALEQELAAKQAACLEEIHQQANAIVIACIEKLWKQQFDPKQYQAELMKLIGEKVVSS